MPTDGERPEGKDTASDASGGEGTASTPGAGAGANKAEPLDPLAQPPLVRKPVPRPPGADAQELETDSPAAAADDAAADEAGVKKSAGDEKASAKPSETVSAPKAKGRFLGFLGLVAGLAALGLAGYLYYLLIYLDPDAPVRARLQSLEVATENSERTLAELLQSQDRALADFAAEQERRQQASAEQVLEAVNRVATQAPPSRREWKIAEVAYLLRIANHRVLMERDAAGALVLLQAADDILKDLDDFALYAVRARLADEILSLENVESNDVQGLFLRLEAVKTEVRSQHVKLPRFDAPATAAAEDAGFWRALMDQLGSYLRFRRFEGESVRPLLAPEEEAYLELNLRLMLERAQLAALRREQVVFEQSLQTAADWIATYLDGSEPGVQKSLEELEVMSRVQLDVPLPDVSGSLSALKDLGEA